MARLRFRLGDTMLSAWLRLLFILGSSQFVTGVLIDFQNCIDPSILSSSALQFVPLFFDARYDALSPSHALNISVHGNVTGSRSGRALPPPSDPSWSNPNVTTGKIPDTDPSWQSSTGELLATTLFARTDVLTYTPWSQNYRFCNQTSNGTTCPLAPVFRQNITDPRKLNSFAVSHGFFSSYAFTTFAATLRITSGSVDKASLGCISANITPDLGPSITAALTYVPVVILILVGIATAFAANYSPWGSTNIYRWTSNYGRDEDLLRLVTPGFADCLQYIQFVVLTGSLSLSYPGYYQPVVAQAAWSVLMFPSNFVSRAPFYQSVADGLYALRIMSHDGLDRMSQYAGIATVADIWAGMMIWLLVVLAAVLVIFQIGASVLWLLRRFGGLIEQDRRRKSIPFSVGMVIRIVFSYFLLPIVALSTYQFVLSAHNAAPTYLVVLAAIFTVSLVAFTLWLAFYVASTGSSRSTKTRANLFDDLPTVLQFGPLYNTYRDDAALFAVVPLAITFLRGIAIGAMQPSGIAQLVLLAICEVLYMLILHAVRPYHAATSMNAYQTFFSAVRVLSIFLLIAFAPSLGVTEAPKGWIGFVVLLMHAIVMVFGFFMNALQTMVEVGARLAGAGGESGAQRGGLVKVLGNRQLRRREIRRDSAHLSVGSRATQLMSDHKMENNRPRSASGSSALLLATTPRSGQRLSQYESGSQATSDNLQHAISESSRQSPAGTPTEPNGNFVFPDNRRSRTTSAGSGQLLNSPSNQSQQQKHTSDPYYRPPRARRPTIEALVGPRSRTSWTSGDWANHRWSQAMAEGAAEPPENLSRGSLVPNAVPEGHIDANPSRKRADYATREVDYYYGVRGPALSEGPTRKMHTGPADPTGPLASATGWVRNLLAGRNKDKGKGFEVVRSQRAPPAGFPAGTAPADGEIGEAKELDALNEQRNMPYTDHPELEANGPFNRAHQSQISTNAPSLPDIETGGDLGISSRVNSGTGLSRQSSNSRRRFGQPLNSASLSKPPSSFRPTIHDPPAIPRRSSKRLSISSSRDHTPSSSRDLTSYPELDTTAAGGPVNPPPHLAIGIADDSDNDSNRSMPGATGLRISSAPYPPPTSSQHEHHLSTSSAAASVSRLPFHSERSSLRSSVGESLLIGGLGAPNPPQSPKFHLRNPYGHAATSSSGAGSAIEDGSDIGTARGSLLGLPDFGSPGDDVGAGAGAGTRAPGMGSNPYSPVPGSGSGSTSFPAAPSATRSSRQNSTYLRPSAATAIGSASAGESDDEEDEGRPMSVGRVQGENLVRIVTPDPGSRESLALRQLGTRATVEGGEAETRTHGRGKSSLSSVLLSPGR